MHKHCQALGEYDAVLEVQCSSTSYQLDMYMLQCCLYIEENTISEHIMYYNNHISILIQGVGM